jgi:hypothetical protein
LGQQLGFGQRLRLRGARLRTLLARTQIRSARITFLGLWIARFGKFDAAMIRADRRFRRRSALKLNGPVGCLF